MRPLLHIGYHKTGTSWLQQCVFSNPEAGFTKIAGLRTLARANPFAFEPEGIRAEVKRKIGRAQARDLIPVLSNERLSGHPHSGGYDSKIIADRLAAVFPNARVLVVIREQADMLTSIYKQYLKKGGAGSFRQYVTAPPDAGRMPLFRFDFLEYHRLVGYYQELFGATNVLVLPYELLATQPDVFLEQIGGFLGVPVTGRWEHQRVNVSPSALSLSLKRHAARWIVRTSLNPSPPFEIYEANEALLRICYKLDAIVPAVLQARYERRWHRFAESEVDTRYGISNAITSKLTSIDLRAFGYVCE